MKKKVFIIISLLMLLLIGGVHLKKTFDKNKLLKTEGPRVEKYLKYNYKDIQSVTFTGIKIHPTGIPHIKGYVNGDKEMVFDASLGAAKFNAGLNFFDKSPDYRFDDYETKNVDEIEAIETNELK